MESLRTPGKITVLERFAPLRAQLLSLLADLDETEWALPTAAGDWCVKDVVAHLLAGDLGILSRCRDGFSTNRQIDSYDELVAYIDRLNHEWAVAMRRMSPRLLCELLAFSGPEVDRWFASLDPDAIGGPVSWAGPEPAPVWLDLAREFTERWHHQQQIRDAAGKAPLYDPYFLSPVLAAFVYALPRAFRQTAAPKGTAVRFEISGSAGGIWYISRTENGWALLVATDTPPVTSVLLSQEIAWRLFTKGIDRQAAASVATVSGNNSLATPIFQATAIIG